MKIILNTTLIIIFFHAFSNPLHAQGLNNKYAIDEADIKTSLKLLGIEIYKFPLQSNENGVYLNYIIEEYHDTTLLERSNNLQNLKKGVPEAYLPNFMSQLLAGHDSSLLRIIMYDNPNGPFELQFNYKDFSINNASSKFDSKKYGNLQTRGFTYSIPKINQKIPVLVVYASEKGQSVVHCPGDALPNEIKRKYPYTCFVYVELTRLK